MKACRGGTLWSLPQHTEVTKHTTLSHHWLRISSNWVLLLQSISLGCLREMERLLAYTHVWLTHQILLSCHLLLLLESRRYHLVLRRRNASFLRNLFILLRRWQSSVPVTSNVWLNRLLRETRVGTWFKGSLSGQRGEGRGLGDRCVCLVLLLLLLVQHLGVLAYKLSRFGRLLLGDTTALGHWLLSEREGASGRRLLIPCSCRR